jgi:hypothetical protein
MMDFPHQKHHQQPQHMLPSGMMEAYAYLRVLTDTFGKPTDLLFLETNGAFETMTGFAEQLTAGKKYPSYLPALKKTNLTGFTF